MHIVDVGATRLVFISNYKLKKYLIPAFSNVNVNYGVVQKTDRWQSSTLGATVRGAITKNETLQCTT